VVPLVVYHVGQLVVDTFIADWLAGRPPRRSGFKPDKAGGKPDLQVGQLPVDGRLA
jgi:hypothetical protein